MGLLKIDNYDGIVKWCQDNAETVREGYAFSKEALIVWTMMTSTHLIKRGIRINCTMPGPTQTPMMSQFEQATAASVLEAAARHQSSFDAGRAGGPVGVSQQ